MKYSRKTGETKEGVKSGARAISVFLLEPVVLGALALSLVGSLGAFGQEKPTMEKIVDLHLPHAAGPVPVYYSSGFEARALKYQRAITACQKWYELATGQAPGYQPRRAE